MEPRSSLDNNLDGFNLSALASIIQSEKVKKKMIDGILTIRPEAIIGSKSLLSNVDFTHHLNFCGQILSMKDTRDMKLL